MPLKQRKQTSGKTGYHSKALDTGRYLLSLDPLWDPMGVLLIMDYYALASRRTSLGLCGRQRGGTGRSLHRRLGGIGQDQDPLQGSTDQSASLVSFGGHAEPVAFVRAGAVSPFVERGRR